MIQYRIASTAPATPPWLEGFTPADRDQVIRMQGDAWHLVTVAEPDAFEVAPDRRFVDIGDGWSAALHGTFSPRAIFRRPSWCRTEPVVDLEGREWQAPVLLNPGGGRVFLVRRGGPDFLPMLTDEQERLLKIAEAARTDLMGDGLETEALVRWAVILLTATHALPEAAMGVLGLMDEQLALATVYAALSLPNPAALG